MKRTDPRDIGKFGLVAALLAALAPGALAQGMGDYDCNAPLTGPDLIVGSINAICEWGSMGSTSAYSIGATSCNVGDTEMIFSGNGTHHPVIAQNLYRLENGRIVQLGQSWVKHAFASATEDLCCNCQSPGNSLIIGVGCADTYGHCQNGVQEPISFQGNQVSGLGPRSDINPTTGEFNWPYTTFGQSGNTLYKRLQVETADVDPNQHPNAQWFAEVQYIGPDEGGVSKSYNNTSYAGVGIGNFSGGIWNLFIPNSTFDTSPAIQAWQDQDPGVTINTVDDSAGGRFYVASRATANGDGTWNYEYAVYNQNSALPARSVQLGSGANTSVTNVGVRDVDSHSGEPYDTTDWGSNVSAEDVSWSTGLGPNANAIRWGTMYNYWFTADEAPGTGPVALELLGSGDILTTEIVRPCGASNYCVAGMNSSGSAASIGWSGSTSFASNNLTLTSTGAIPNSFGLFFYGSGQTQEAFGDGFRCVGGAMTFRLPPPAASDGSGSASRALDFTLPPLNSGAGMVTPGSTWNFQHWYRDLGGLSGFNLSDGLSVTVCP